MFAGLFALVIAAAPALPATPVEQCLGTHSAHGDVARAFAAWSALEDRHRWNQAARAGVALAAKGVQCVTGSKWRPSLTQDMLIPLQWAMLAGVDAFRSGDAALMRSIGKQYQGIAENYQALTKDDFEREGYKHVLLYFADFADGRCSYDLCTARNYP